jgi:hypothetical protein
VESCYSLLFKLKLPALMHILANITVTILVLCAIGIHFLLKPFSFLFLHVLLLLLLLLTYLSTNNEQEDHVTMIPNLLLLSPVRLLLYLPITYSYHAPA